MKVDRPKTSHLMTSSNIPVVPTANKVAKPAILPSRKLLHDIAVSRGLVDVRHVFVTAEQLGGSRYFVMLMLPKDVTPPRRGQNMPAQGNALGSEHGPRL